MHVLQITLEQSFRLFFEKIIKIFTKQTIGVTLKKNSFHFHFSSSVIATVNFFVKIQPLFLTAPLMKGISGFGGHSCLKSVSLNKFVTCWVVYDLASSSSPSDLLHRRDNFSSLSNNKKCCEKVDLAPWRSLLFSLVFRKYSLICVWFREKSSDQRRVSEKVTLCFQDLN